MIENCNFNLNPYLKRLLYYKMIFNRKFEEIRFKFLLILNIIILQIF